MLNRTSYIHCCCNKEINIQTEHIGELPIMYCTHRLTETDISPCELHVQSAPTVLLCSSSSPGHEPLWSVRPPTTCNGSVCRPQIWLARTDSRPFSPLDAAQCRSPVHCSQACEPCCTLNINPSKPVSNSSSLLQKYASDMKQNFSSFTC